MSANDKNHQSMETSAAGISETVATEPSTTITAEERFSSTLKQLLAEGRPHLLDWLTEQAVRQAYMHGNGNQVQAAKLIGISRNAFRTLMKRAGLLSGEGRVGRVVDDLRHRLLRR